MMKNNHLTRVLLRGYSYLFANLPLYKGIALSLLVHLTLFTIIFVTFITLTSRKLPPLQIIPVKLVTVKIGTQHAPKMSIPSSTTASVKPTPVKPVPQPVKTQAAITPPAHPTTHTAPKLVEADADTDEEEESDTPVLHNPPKTKGTLSHKKAHVRQPQYAKAETSTPKAAPPVETRGSEIGNSATSEEALRTYEQLIALWFEQHKTYPAQTSNDNDEGQALLRIRIDRRGNILFYRLEHSTGNKTLDNAVIAMVKQSNPVPPIPPQYTDDNQVEFLLPISFTHNQ